MTVVMMIQKGHINTFKTDFKYFEEAVNGSQEYQFWKQLNNMYSEQDILVGFFEKVYFLFETTSHSSSKVSWRVFLC